MSAQLYRHLNAATGAPRSSARSRVVLAIALALLAASTLRLADRWQQLVQARSERATLAQREQEQRANVQQQQRTANDAIAAERVSALARASGLLQFSWDGFFDALEQAARAVDGGVSLITLVPSNPVTIEPTVSSAALASGALSSLSADNTAITPIQVTAIAANTSAMLAYADRLRADGRMVAVEISAQQPDPKSGPDVVRFQLALLWDPALGKSVADTAPITHLAANPGSKP